ncbi:MAG TPA: DpnII family type II restriction endonuclease [Thermoanaerobaculia bacterium]|nr:DpnII family type II restriction endonuclease [Thermoanaerobaculia bacterium]
MKFTKIGLDLLLSELADLPSEWLDDEARHLVSVIPAVVERIRTIGPAIDTTALKTLLTEQPLALDVLRLLAGEGQEPMAHRICDALGGKRRGWTALRSLTRKAPEEMASALVAMGMSELIREQVWREWTINDVLVDRYKLGRGRAIAGQSRGRGLENEVEAILRGIPVPYATRVTFTGAAGTTAKCDFAVPSRDEPLIVIEAKGYEATGSKLTDFLGDILKIKQAKGYHTYLFVVTDGRGWFNRQSDLKRLLDLHQEGIVEMIYTRARLGQLGEDVRQIWTAER